MLDQCFLDTQLPACKVYRGSEEQETCLKLSIDYLLVLRGVQRMQLHVLTMYSQVEQKTHTWLKQLALFDTNVATSRKRAFFGSII